MLMTSAESLSTMAFFIPSQLRISRPVSRVPNSAVLLGDFPRLPMYSHMMFPLLSLITPLRPVLPGFPFTAPSKFNLRETGGGGFQLRSPTWSCGCCLFGLELGHRLVGKPLGLWNPYQWVACYPFGSCGSSSSRVSWRLLFPWSSLLANFGFWKCACSFPSMSTIWSFLGWGSNRGSPLLGRCSFLCRAWLLRLCYHRSCLTDGRYLLPSPMVL